MTKYTAKLAADLRLLGVKAGDILLVHTSMKGLNTPELAPDDVIQVLLDILTPEGTLLVPALSYSDVTPQYPVFDARNTPSCIGALPERFRLKWAEYRSIHPTHSVCARGKMAYAMTAWHRLDNTPVGSHSPFMQLPKLNGKILMLGCGLRPNTFMHGVEEAAHASYPLAKKTVRYTVTDMEGNTSQQEYFPHSFGTLIQRYDRLQEVMSREGLAEGAVLMGKSYLIDAAEAYRAGVGKIREEEEFFVERPGQEKNI